MTGRFLKVREGEYPGITGTNYEEKLDSKSMGLTGMQSRINFLKGTLTVNTAPGQGASFKISIPC
jgi:signal transduction histidine kinase